MAWAYLLWVWLRLKYDALRLRLRRFRAEWNGQHYIVLLGYGHQTCWPAFNTGRSNWIKLHDPSVFSDPVHGQAPHHTYSDALDIFRERYGDAPWSRIYNTKTREYISP
ncbi:hypothetical protein [Xanthomonas phage SB3]|uniref:Uncharacterized protein n=1 Tax=Xanthomonas phage SB3 TaxID=3117472 RepID=A0ABZ2GVG5_9CAUD